MPRYSKQDKTRRYMFDDRDTHDYTTPSLSVYARPVDPYARPGEAPRVPQDATAKAFVMAIGGLQSALAGAVETKKMQDDGEKKAGQRAAASGQPVPESATKAFLYGHELISGKAAAAELDTVLSKYYDDAADEPDVEKVIAGHQRVIREFTAGRSDAYLDGLLPDAIQLDREYSVKYHKRVVEKVKLDGLARLGQGFESDIRRIYGDATMDPEARAQAAREVLTGVQELGKSTYPLSRMEISEAMLQVVDRVSTDLADPSIWDVVTKEHAGVRLIDNPKLAPKIEAGIRSATSEQRRVKNEVDSFRKQEQARIENEVQSVIIGILADPGASGAQIQEAHQLLKAYSHPDNNPNGIVVNPGILTSGYRLLSERSQGFAQQTDYGKFDLAYDKFMRGDGTLEDLVAVKRFVEEDKYNALRGVLYREGSKAMRSPARREFDTRVIGEAKSVNQPAMPGLQDQNGQNRYNHVRDYSMAWWNDYKLENNGKEPSVEEQRKKLNELRKDAADRYPQMIFGQEFQAPSAAPPAPPAQVPQAPKLGNPGISRNAQPDVSDPGAAALDRVRKKKQGQ